MSQATVDTSEGLNFYGAALDLLSYQGREVLICGPAGTGKSLACLQKLYFAAQLVPGLRCLIVRKTRASCTESALVTFEQHVLPEDHQSRGRISRLHRHTYTLGNRSEIIVGGMDKSTRILSTEFDLIYAQEATELLADDWEALMTRLRHHRLPYQQILACCNPDAPTHWLKRRCDDGKCKLLTSLHTDNPRLYEPDSKEPTEEGKEYLEKLKALSGHRRERYYSGRWVAAEGVVFPDWNRRTHLVEPFDVPSGWRRIRAIDFGYVNPFVCLWIACDNDGRMYVYRYIYKTCRLVEDHARDIIKLSRMESIEATIADHDAEDRATLKRHGVKTVAADKRLEIGLQTLQARMRLQKDGKPRLFIMENACVDVDWDLRAETGRTYLAEQEFETYRYATGTLGRRNPNEQPIDENNHAIDAIRYAAMYLDKPKPKTLTTSDGSSTRRTSMRRF